MDRASIEQHLTQAERHVEEGERHTRRQRQIIEELKRDGHDTTNAEELLAQFERTQATHIQGKDRLRSELAAL